MTDFLVIAFLVLVGVPVAVAAATLLWGAWWFMIIEPIIRLFGGRR